jgi:hypothetical protein
MSLVFHPLVQRDINTALRYYDEEGGSGLGDRFYAELDRKLGEVEKAPIKFPPVSGEIRQGNLQKSPTIFYFGFLRVASASLLYATTGGIRTLAWRGNNRSKSARGSFDYPPP